MGRLNLNKKHILISLLLTVYFVYLLFGFTTCGDLLDISICIPVGFLLLAAPPVGIIFLLIAWIVSFLLVSSLNGFQKKILPNKARVFYASIIILLVVVGILLGPTNYALGLVAAISHSDLPCRLVVDDKQTSFYDWCISGVAKAKNDPNECNLLGGRYRTEQCAEGVFKNNKDVKVCDKVANRTSCIQKIAVFAEKSEYCDLLGPSDKEKCLSDMGYQVIIMSSEYLVENVDRECSRINDNVSFAKCAFGRAVQTRNPQLCLSMPFANDFCLSEVGIASNDVAVCNMIAVDEDYRSKYRRDDCIYGIAKKDRYGNGSICLELAEGDRDSCYYTVAEVTQNMTFCDLIKDGYVGKSSCYTAIEK
jgi:hypothetical protein